MNYDDDELKDTEEGIGEPPEGEEFDPGEEVAGYEDEEGIGEDKDM